MNGREQVSTGDNRAIEFDQYPSELINSVIVYKTPDSQLSARASPAPSTCGPSGRSTTASRRIVMNLRGETNSQ